MLKFVDVQRLDEHFESLVVFDFCYFVPTILKHHCSHAALTDMSFSLGQQPYHPLNCAVLYTSAEHCENGFPRDTSITLIPSQP